MGKLRSKVEISELKDPITGASFIITAEAIANKIAVNIFPCAPLVSELSLSHCGLLFKWKKSPDTCVAITSPTSMGEIISVLRKSKNKKAPGEDGIGVLTLKTLFYKDFNILVDLINACISLGYFPSAWCAAKVCLVPKPGKDLRDVGAYRPISLLDTMSKILERVVGDRLTDFLSLKRFL